jgi:FtsP/CotA-like multicopper oxidase with cupredoxin domain
MNGSQFDTWSINNQSWPSIDPLHVRQGRRHRMIFRTVSGGAKEFSGLRKDVVNVMPLDSVAVEFVAENPGDTLLRCHQALHIGVGFMRLTKYLA